MKMEKYLNLYRNRYKFKTMKSSIVQMLHFSYKELDSIYINYAKQNNLSISSFWILYSINQNSQPLTQTEMCNIWTFTQQTINTSLKNLEKDGLIELRFSESNKKNKYIFLTERGQTLSQKIVIPLIKAEEEAMTTFLEEQQILYNQFIKKHYEQLTLALEKNKK